MGTGGATCILRVSSQESAIRVLTVGDFTSGILWPHPIEQQACGGLTKASCVASTGVCTYNDQIHEHRHMNWEYDSTLSKKQDTVMDMDI